MNPLRNLGIVGRERQRRLETYATNCRLATLELLEELPDLAGAPGLITIVALGAAGIVRSRLVVLVEPRARMQQAAGIRLWHGLIGGAMPCDATKMHFRGVSSLFSPK